MFAGFFGCSTFDLSPFWLGSTLMMTLFSCFLIFDIKKNAMSKKNRVTIVKSLELDKQNNELIVTTVQNYKKFESVQNIPIEEVQISGEFLTPSNTKIDFHRQSCKFEYY